MFSIRSINNEIINQAKYEIIIGDFRETSLLVTSLWTTDEYELQWKSALESLLDCEVNSCVLITDMQPENDSAGITCWALFREESKIYFQERLVWENYKKLIGSPINAEAYMAPRIQGTPVEHSMVSEWICSIDDIRLR